jgi:tetratricopeptide (TPR) repeat protein
MGSVGESDKILRRKAVSYSNRGDLFFFYRDNQDLALSSYQIALAIRKQLAARDPANPQWQRDLAVSFDHIGDVRRAQGNLSATLSSYQQSLQIAEKLAARDPANTQWQTDLVASLYKIATVLEQQTPPKKQEAATNYQRILNILRPLAATNRLAADQKGRITDVEEARKYKAPFARHRPGRTPPPEGHPRPRRLLHLQCAAAAC